MYTHCHSYFMAHYVSEPQTKADNIFVTNNARRHGLPCNCCNGVYYKESQVVTVKHG